MMQSVLGEDGYKRMVQHMAEHRNGMQSMYDNSPGGMMHQMMDGMMQRMPDDKGHSRGLRRVYLHRQRPYGP